MKKLNNKGFLLTEALVVSTLLITVMLVLFSQFKNMNRKVENTFKYDSISSLYKMSGIKNYIEEENFPAYIGRLEKEDYVDLTTCSEAYFSSPSYCKTVLSDSGVARLIIANENLYSLKQTASFDESFNAYIKQINNTTANNGYRIIASFKDGSYANMRVLVGSEFDEKIASSCSIYTRKKYTVDFIDDTGISILGMGPYEYTAGCGTTINTQTEFLRIIQEDTNVQNIMTNCYTAYDSYIFNLVVGANELDNVITYELDRGFSSITFEYKNGSNSIATNRVVTFPYCNINNTYETIDTNLYIKDIAGYRYTGASVSSFRTNSGDTIITLNYEVQ